MGKTMRAAYYEEFGELDNIKTGDIDKPEPGEGEVLVKVKAAGVNPVDAAVARGMLKDAIPTEFPVIPGWDVAGVVEENGFAARRFKEGDEVYAYARRPKIQHGTFAEYIALPESYLTRRPEKISMEEAGGIPLVGLTAYQAIFDAGSLENGQTVLILGASGGVGTLAIQLAKSVGATVIGVASEKNHSYMKELGADEAVDYSDTQVGQQVDKLAPNGVDLIFHCSRGNSLSQCMESGVLSNNGKVVSITKSKPDESWDVNYQYVFVEPNSSQLAHLAELANDGKLKIPSTKTYSIDETAQSLKDVETLHNRGKLIIKP
ncbi:NADP-dependent oxidoreductase [Rhodohalobacter sp. 8-1]|uniref:NADP-dependent oxidoreductase n=1 Tax=Rhodohalobacter sp. 8-1 TaxID=3131972 RepID=UPI0030EDFAAD